MRLGFFLLVVVTALLASCDASAARSVNEIPSGRFLRSESFKESLKILPKTYVKELVDDGDKLKAALQAWSQSSLSRKHLAKSLELSTSRFKIVREAANRHKTSEAFILNEYVKHLKQLKRSPRLPKVQ
ncbi:hypothetical protein P3T76_009653 [Phytophthora citrophthora]|uniref:RxLR effector protein n=1 Tax=Phytophthora citrophthora TaxID=4793 RepID=A0AAD9GG64_9STRA|nr:hypothetical protein P3T76_009653 [Phytophthora citrophthora]